MRLTVILICVIITSLAGASSIKLESILSLKLGDSINELPTSYESKLFSYDSEIKENRLIKLSIFFNKLVESQKYLNNLDEGYCFIQLPPGDFLLPRYYFFNKSLNKRYEVTSDLKLKSILMQDMSEANKHQTCIFKDVIQSVDKKF